MAEAQVAVGYEYHVMGANTLQGVQKEIERRTREGWELYIAYQETSGGFFGFFGRRHVLIFRRPRQA
jgi:hypothetical protein